jgi:hypothetical protein
MAASFTKKRLDIYRTCRLVMAKVNAVNDGCFISHRLLKLHPQVVNIGSALTTQ